MTLPSSLNVSGWDIKYSVRKPEVPFDAHILGTIVFVHGTPWSSVVFEPLAKALLSTGRYRVVLYDMPGYGMSQAYESPDDTPISGDKLFNGDTSVKFQGTALAELLKHLHLDGKDGNTKSAVIAHDIAGTIALRAHLIHGCKFASLMLWDTNTVLPWGDGFYKQVRSEPEAYLKMPSHIFEAVVRAVIRSGCYSQKKLVPEWEDLLVQPWLNTAGTTETGQQKSFVRQIAQANDADVAEMLDHNMYSQVHCPVKILWGEQDTWIPKEKMEKLAGMLDHCLKSFVVVPEAGHLLMIDQPERVTLEVYKWLEHQE